MILVYFPRSSSETMLVRLTQMHIFKHGMMMQDLCFFYAKSVYRRSFWPGWCSDFEIETWKTCLNHDFSSSKAFHSSCKSRSGWFNLKPNSHRYKTNMKLPPSVLNGSCYISGGDDCSSARTRLSSLEIWHWLLRCWGRSSQIYSASGPRILHCLIEPGTMVCAQGHIKWACLSLNEFGLGKIESNELGSDPEMKFQ